MGFDEVPFSTLLSNVVDNRGKTCPTSEEGIPLIATNCVRDDILYPSYDKARFVSQETYDNWFRAHPSPGDILFVNKATPGRVCLVPDPVDFCIAQDMVAVRADSKKVYPKYLFAVLRSSVVRERIAQLHVGTLIPHFKKGDFNKLAIPVPPSRVQRFIGDSYFDLSAKIDANRRMSETLEAMARAMFKSWFVDFDPVRAKAEGRDPGLPSHIAELFPGCFEESELGEVPRGWRVGQLSEFSTLNPESWSRETRPNLIRYVDLSNTKWGRIAEITVHALEDVPSRAQRILRHGDTIVGTVRPGNGSYALVHEAGLTGSTGFAVLRPVRKEFVEFVYLAATGSDSIEALAHLADGGAYPAVRPEVVLATKVVRANDQIFTRFSEVTGSVIAKMAQTEKESRVLAALRDTLLPKLISGELRVKSAERLVEGVA